MAALETVAARLDRLIEFFNTRRLDLPDGLFDRRTQFLLNGSPFETLLGRSPADPLILMLARGPAGYRFTIKAVQHALPDAHIDRGDFTTAGEGSATGGLWLSGTLRGSGERLETQVTVSLTLAADDHIEQAAATLDEGDLDRIRTARLRP